MATWWAEVELTEYGEKEKVKENFWLDFGQKLPKVSDSIFHVNIFEYDFIGTWNSESSPIRI